MHLVTIGDLWLPANFLELSSTTGPGLLTSIFEIIVTINYGPLAYFLESTSITISDAISESCSLEFSATDYVSSCNSMKLKLHYFEL